MASIEETKPHNKRTSQGRRKIDIKKLEKKSNKQVTFSKRRSDDERKMTKQKDANKPKGRGRTKKNDINNLKAQGRKTKLEWNEKGEPIGTAYADMQSWIGVKARSTVPLTYDDWRHVDSKLKEKIWKDTYDAFELPETYKPKLLSDAGKMMKTQVARARMNLSHHRSSRRGMPNVEQDLMHLGKFKSKTKRVIQDKVIAINQLSIWLNTMTHVGQYYFIPWNIGKHWMLIIAMTSGRVVFLNPLKSKIPSDIAQMIKAAYANISSNAIVFGKNGPEIWTFACPKQPYNYECGYYVLTYIRDMLQHSNPIEAIKAKFGGLSQYSEDDHLLPLRQQWLNNV
ncbi:hypothetical protein F8388_009326 [Cannabis sativa]|uniref:MADS-box domain-containing protein n=1 Tax=Cannabis sativa TaxID=3483 RepID=A0A7J6GK37_CANSA|nr:hypothetical protein F8388_009326 [Cannabis sativa]